MTFALEDLISDLFTRLTQAIEQNDKEAVVGLIGQIENCVVLELGNTDRYRKKLEEMTAEFQRRPAPERALPAFDFRAERDASARSKGVTYSIWFGTNRKPALSDDIFSADRGDETILGRAKVYIPRSHRFGETGSSFWRQLLRFDIEDDHLQLCGVENLPRQDFYSQLAEIRRAVEKDGQTSHALFFLHGYNVSFKEAAIRAAQIGYDLKIPGPTAFFSWPSRGRLVTYPADEAAIEASERAITEFILDFARNCGVEKIHIVAHSMGNRALLRALQRIEANISAMSSVKFNQIILAAPDIDRDLFLDLSRLYPLFSQRTTLYTSESDRAVHLSAKIHLSPRAGYYPPFTLAPGIDTISVPNFDVDLLGHSYFSQAEAMLHDIYDLIRNNPAPSSRQRTIPIEGESGPLWALRR